MLREGSLWLTLTRAARSREEVVRDLVAKLEAIFPSFDWSGFPGKGQHPWEDDTKAPAP